VGQHVVVGVPLLVPGALGLLIEGEPGVLLVETGSW
jgi:hypothetical protein